jgi:hypothetical protein
MDMVGPPEKADCSLAHRDPQDQEIVMAQVIEFYMPNNFRKPLQWAAQLQRGKVVEFCPQIKKSA